MSKGKRKNALPAAPIVIVILMILSAAAVGSLYFKVFSMAPFPVFFRIGALTVTAAVIGLLVAVLIQRVKEIQRGEEDDLGKY